MIERTVTQTVTVEEPPEPAAEPAPAPAPAPPEGRSPEDVLALQYEYINRGDYESAYSLLAEQSRQEVSLDQYLAFFGANSPYSVTDYSFPSVQTQGESATLEAVFTVNSPAGAEPLQRTQQLVRENGDWRVVLRPEQIAAFTATPSTATPSESQESPGEPPPDEQAGSGEVIVRVTGDPGIRFQGNIGTIDSSRSVEGTTPADFAVELDQDFFSGDVVSANAQNMDGAGNLTVQIVSDGAVVQESSTSAQYGLAQVTWAPWDE